MIPAKIQSWLDVDYLPQRLLLSGTGDLLSMALEMGAIIQKKSIDHLNRGICADTQVFRDEGVSFKIGKSDNPDTDTVRGMIGWISQKPVAPHRLIILENFERLSREAPQAILKILEEPPEKACFIFTTKNHFQILDTIISRMTVVTVINKEEGGISELLSGQDFFDKNIFQNFFDKSHIISNFRFIEDLDKEIKKQKNKKILWDFLQGLILFLRQNQIADKLILAVETERYLRGNGNVRLGLERLIMKEI